MSTIYAKIEQGLFGVPPGKERTIMRITNTPEEGVPAVLYTREANGDISFEFMGKYAINRTIFDVEEIPFVIEALTFLKKITTNNIKNPDQ